MDVPTSVSHCVIYLPFQFRDMVRGIIGSRKYDKSGPKDNHISIFPRRGVVAQRLAPVVDALHQSTRR